MLDFGHNYLNKTNICFSFTPCFPLFVSRLGPPDLELCRSVNDWIQLLLLSEINLLILELWYNYGMLIEKKNYVLIRFIT